MLQTFDRIGPFIVVLSQSEAIPARKRRVVVRCVVCERVSEMNERSLLDKRTEEQRACAKCRVYTTNGTWVKGWKAKMESTAAEANRLNEENARLRDEIDKVLRERDLALGRLENEIKAANQARAAEERARESLDELDAAIYECLPSDYDDDSPLDCVEHAADRLRELAEERDEWRDKFHALNQTAGELCDACGWAFKIPGEPCRCEVVKERDEARAETARLRRLLNMAEDELVAADDHGRREAKRADNVEAEVEALKAERDEARADMREFVRQAEDAYALLKPLEEGSDVVERAVGHLLTVLRGRERPGPWAFDAVLRERDEARAEAKEYREQLRKLPDANRVSNQDAYRRGAEAMRETAMNYARKIGFYALAADIRCLPAPEEP